MTIAIISGGTQGLGEAIARQLAGDSQSDGILLVGRSDDRGHRLADELTAAGTLTSFLRADVTEPPSAIVDACIDRFGTVHQLVNVAATTTRATLFEDDPSHFERVLRVNLQAPYFLIQAAARVMIRDGNQGSIVNIGSTSGYGGQPNLTAYSASKGALTVVTKNLAYALMRHNIRVNQVNPGWMETESEHRTQIDEDGAPADWLERASATRPIGRLVQTWEVANVVAFCLSTKAGLMTGACIDMDQSVQGAGNPPTPSVADTPPADPAPRKERT